MKEKKTYLIEALVRKALAYADMEDAKSPDKFDETLKQLKAWVDIDAMGKYAALSIERERRAGRFGNALKLINKALSKETKEETMIKPLSKSDLLGMRAKIFEELGFFILVEYDRSTRVTACPKSFDLF